MTQNETRLLSAITTEMGAFTTTEAEVMDAVILRDLKPDSLDVIAVSMAIEDAFGITLGEEEILGLGEKATLRDLLALVEGKVVPA